MKLGDTYITVLYCYLQHKNQIAYSEMWSEIERQCRQRNFFLNIQHLVIDFEIAVINSFEQVFGNEILKQEY